MKTRTALILLMILTILPAQSAIIRVKIGGNDASDGSTWDLAKATVQGGLSASASGDEVWVAAGVYLERITLKDGAALYGGFAGVETERNQRNWSTNVTVLDGNKAGTVVTSPSGATPTTIIDGFTIRNGNNSYGGGIYCSSSSPTILNNLIAGNHSAAGISCENSSPYISGNTITGNIGGACGGIFCTASSSPTIYRNTISANDGSGIYCYGSSPTISGNNISANTSMSTGRAGIYCIDSSPTICNNTISGSNFRGVFCSNSSPIICNNTITGNSCSDSTGAGIYCYLGSPSISNNIIAFNSSGLFGSGGTPVMTNNCVYNPEGVDYSGVTPGLGDIQVDPKLAAVELGRTHIQPDSPCVDAGNDGAVHAGWVDIDGQARIQGSHVDMGADESDGTVWSDTPVIVRVRPTGDDSNDGSSWALAKRTIRAGANAASAQGGEVWVAAGTYQESMVLLSYAYLYGGFAGTESLRAERDWNANITIIDGGRSGTVVSARTGARVTASSIDGFTIQNGRGPGMSWSHSSVPISNNTITGNTGAGISCSDSSPLISGNTITGNTGAGIYCDDSSPAISNNRITGNKGGISCSKSSPQISDNTISGNAIGNGGGIYCYYSSPGISGNSITDNRAGGYGGGICCYHSSATISNNSIWRNSAVTDGGGIYYYYSSPGISGNSITDNSAGGYGGGIYCDHSSPTISNNSISRNSAVSDGGGVYGSWSNPTISDNIITANSGLNGGGIGCLESTGRITISSNIISENNASAYGGGMFCDTCAPFITNNTIVANSGSSGGGGIYWSAWASTLSNNIVAFNSSGICRVLGTAAIDNSDVFGNASYDYSGFTPIPTGANGNISLDPLFVNRAGGNYHLTANSPCISAGLNTATGLGSTDIDRQPRIQGETVDIGADEFWPASSLREAKSIADGLDAALMGSVVTAAFPDSFYIEQDDRSSGIRVDKPAHGLGTGTRVDVVGWTDTSDNGERCIEATSASALGSGSLAPLLLNNRTLGGGTFGLQQGVWGFELVRQPDDSFASIWHASFGLNNIGLLIKTSGRVTYSDPSGFFYLDDGSKLDDGSGHPGVKVFGTASEGGFVTVTGISSCEKSGLDLIRVIRTRVGTDITELD